MKMDDHTLALYHGLQQVYVLLDDGDRRALRAVGLTPTQYNLLRQVYARDGATITELSQVLLCTRGNITRLVQRLAQQGLVRCGGDDRDQRLVRVSLTPQGALRLEDARIVYEASIRRRLGTLDHASQERLHTLLDALIAALSADLVAQPAILAEVPES